MGLITDVLPIRDHVIAASLKPGNGGITDATFRAIRDHVIAASLKQLASLHMNVIQLAIRDHVIAASLKQTPAGLCFGECFLSAIM